MRLYIVYENSARDGFESGWGFSCLIEIDSENILFDTGAEPDSLLHNMRKLKLDPKKVSTVVISHRHHDHAGGLDGFLKANGNRAKVIWPDRKDGFEVSRGVYSTGALSSGLLGVREQSLVLKSRKGLVVLVGCSHPGVDRILERVKELRRGEHIHAIIGGFHGFRKMERLEGIDIIGACHCTQYTEEIKKMYPKNFREVSAGDVIEI